MSKKQVQDLQHENESLKLQVQTLKSQLDDLNENTVISSMNEMKERYDHMMENTVCINKFYNLKNYYTRYLTLARTVDNVTDVIRDDVNRLIHFLSFYKPGHATFNEETKEKRINVDLSDISNRLLMVTQLLNREDDEWTECECEDH